MGNNPMDGIGLYAGKLKERFNFSSHKFSRFPLPMDRLGAGAYITWNAGQNSIVFR